MKSETNTNLLGGLLAKLIACLFILICLAVGLVGLIMPIIPGLLFLAIAAMIAANIFPGIDGWLRKNQTMSRYLDSGQGFLKLNFWGKVQYSCWLCVKIFIDSIMIVVTLAAKVMSFSSNKYRYYKQRRPADS